MRTFLILLFLFTVPVRGQNTENLPDAAEGIRLPATLAATIRVQGGADPEEDGLVLKRAPDQKLNRIGLLRFHMDAEVRRRARRFSECVLNMEANDVREGPAPFILYGVPDGDSAEDETVTVFNDLKYGQPPKNKVALNPDGLVRLGKVVVAEKGVVRFSSVELLKFVRADRNGTLAFYLEPNSDNRETFARIYRTANRRPSLQLVSDQTTRNTTTDRQEHFLLRYGSETEALGPWAFEPGTEIEVLNTTFTLNCNTAGIFTLRSNRTGTTYGPFKGLHGEPVLLGGLPLTFEAP
jgi:hypothetical protein